MNYQEVEQARELYSKKIKKELFVIIAICIGLIVLLSMNGGAVLGFAFSAFFMVIMVSTIITSLVNRKARRAYHQAYKKYFVERNLQSIFTNLTYSHEAGLSPVVLQRTGMINTGDRYSSNDFATGEYKDVSFTQADVHIETEHTDSDGDTHYVTIFRGRFMVFEFPKKFNFRLGLIGKKFQAYRKPSTNKATGRKVTKISTESNEFNSMFRIYGEDGFEAFYILDPAFMVKLMDINTRHKGKIIFCFIDNQLIIGISDGKDSFEPPRPFKQIDEATENAKVSSEIKTITDFVDQLSLSRKLFKD